MLAIFLFLAYAGVSYFIASGVTRAERTEFEDHPTDYGLEYEDVEFVSRKGDVTLMGWYLPSPGCEASVIHVHGISSNRTSREATRIAAHLVEECFNVLLFDLRAHGTSGGARITGGIDEAQDVLGAYDYLQSRGSHPHRIGVLGRSMGAGAAVLAAAAEPGIRTLVLDSTYAEGKRSYILRDCTKNPCSRLGSAGLHSRGVAACQRAVRHRPEQAGSGASDQIR